MFVMMPLSYKTCIACQCTCLVRLQCLVYMCALACACYSISTPPAKYTVLLSVPIVPLVSPTTLAILPAQFRPSNNTSL